MRMADTAAVANAGRAHAPLEHAPAEPEAPVDDPLEVALLTEERDVALWGAFARLSERCQTLLRLLVSSNRSVPQNASFMPLGLRLYWLSVV